MSLEQQLSEAIAAQNALTQAVANWKERIDASVAAQQAAFAAWRNQVFRQVAVTTDLKQYRTILRVHAINPHPDLFVPAVACRDDR